MVTAYNGSPSARGPARKLAECPHLIAADHELTDIELEERYGDYVRRVIPQLAHPDYLTAMAEAAARILEKGWHSAEHKPERETV